MGSIEYSEDSHSFQEQFNALDDATRKYFVVLGDVAPPRSGTFSLEWMSRGWAIPLKEAQTVANKLVEAGLLYRRQVVAQEQFYSMDDNLREYAKTMIEPDTH